MSKQGLVLHQGAIGDFMLSLSVIQSVREALPVSRVVTIASAPSVVLAAGRSAVDEWISPDAAGLHLLFGEGPVDDVLRKMVAEADWVLSFLGDAQTSFSRRIRELAHGQCICIDPRPRLPTLRQRRHITDQWADDIREQGIDLARPIAPTIRLSGSAPISLQVMIHPGSGGREKCWPLDKFIELADLMRLTVDWLLGPAEAERNPDWVKRLQHRTSDRRESLFVEEDVVNAAKRITSCALYVGNDAGMTHVAAALGIPTIAIFGPTDPQVWRPLNPNVIVVSPPETGPIESVGVDEVFAAIKALRLS